MNENIPRVVHVKDNVDGAVYVGRANGRARLKQSPFHNPHKVKDYGDRNLAIMAYANDLRFGKSRHLLADLPALREAPALACWCRHDGEERTAGNTCHADTLVLLLRMFTDSELREMAEGEW